MWATVGRLSHNSQRGGSFDKVTTMIRQSIKSKVLQTEKILGSHTGENLATELYIHPWLIAKGDEDHVHYV